MRFILSQAMSELCERWLGFLSADQCCLEELPIDSGILDRHAMPGLVASAHKLVIT
jgi:hypothetical protein